jgi:biopolymer transport protein ExbB
VKEIILAGGWMMAPILVCSVLAMAIILERFWSTRVARIAPRHLLAQVWTWMKNNQLNASRLRELRASSPLGRILAAGLSNARHGREITKESIEQSASQAIHQMEKHLNALGTIAQITPLMGLLGTVIGMISVFTTIVSEGTGNAGALAGGISEALITTAAGLMVAIPTLVCHRAIQRRVDNIAVFMEQEAVKLVDVLHGEREVSDGEGGK